MRSGSLATRTTVATTTPATNRMATIAASRFRPAALEAVLVTARTLRRCDLRLRELSLVDLPDEVDAEAVVRFLLDELEPSAEVDGSGRDGHAPDQVHDSWPREAARAAGTPPATLDLDGNPLLLPARTADHVGRPILTADRMASHRELRSHAERFEAAALAVHDHT